MAQLRRSADGMTIIPARTNFRRDVALQCIRMCSNSHNTFVASDGDWCLKRLLYIGDKDTPGFKITIPDQERALPSICDVEPSLSAAIERLHNLEFSQSDGFSNVESTRTSYILHPYIRLSSMKMALPTLRTLS